MKVEYRSIGAIGLFLLPIALIYWIAAPDEWAGILLLLLGGIAMLFLATYLYVSARKVPPRPEDAAEPELTGGSDVVGRFPSGSVWPLVVGLGATAVGYGLAFTAWIWGPGVLVLVLGLVGLARESAV